MKIEQIASKYIHRAAIIAATASALFAGAATAATAPKHKTAKSPLSIQNLCKPGSLQILSFGQADATMERKDGARFILLQFTRDKYVTHRKAKISYVKACALQDYLVEGVETIAPMGIPHLSLVILGSNGTTATDSETESKFGFQTDFQKEETVGDPEQVAVSQQEITAGLKDKIEASKAPIKVAQVIYIRDMDHGQVDYFGTQVRNETLQDARPVLTKLIVTHQIQMEILRREKIATAAYKLYSALLPPALLAVESSDSLDRLQTRWGLMPPADPFDPATIMQTAPVTLEANAAPQQPQPVAATAPGQIPHVLNGTVETYMAMTNPAGKPFTQLSFSSLSLTERKQEERTINEALKRFTATPDLIRPVAPNAVAQAMTAQR